MQAVERFLMTYELYRKSCDSLCGKSLKGRYDAIDFEIDLGCRLFYEELSHVITMPESDLERFSNLMDLRIKSVVPNVTGHPSFQVYRMRGWSGELAGFLASDRFLRVLELYVTSLDKLHLIILDKAYPLCTSEYIKHGLPPLLADVRKLLAYSVVESDGTNRKQDFFATFDRIFGVEYQRRFDGMNKQSINSDALRSVMVEFKKLMIDFSLKIQALRPLDRI